MIGKTILSIITIHTVHFKALKLILEFNDIQFHYIVK